LEALAEMVEQDPDLWATHFPLGYRERMTPQGMGEVYSSGKTAKEFGKSFIKERNLGECDEAREIIPTGAALDNIFLIDRTPGAINLVGTEKLARKFLGIKEGFKEVWKESDWKKTGKNSKIKIDYEQWERIDPAKKDKEHTFVNRKVEDEIRGEMERDAALLKARLKLAEQQKKG